MHALNSPVAEFLEPRRFMDASAALADGVLTITGTERRDAIFVELDRTDATQLRVKIGRNVNVFDLTEVESAIIDTGAGADRVTISERRGKIFLPFKIDAGMGSDTILTGSGNDVIVAGAGNDSVKTGAGDDQIDGGDGNDRLTGGGDDDLILAGAGKDKLSGGTGSDNLDGGGGRDAIVTGTGADEIAVDDTNVREVKDRAADRAADGQYQVAEFASLSTELQMLHEEAVPGSVVSRVEIQGNIVNMYYRFGTDPEMYKTVLDIGGPEFELVNREISPNEIRQPARDAFIGRYPGAEVLSVFQHAGARDDIRYRDVDGTIQQVTTTDLIWTIDDAGEDADNDGINDHGGQHEGEYDDENGGGQDGGGEMIGGDEMSGGEGV